MDLNTGQKSDLSGAHPRPKQGRGKLSAATGEEQDDGLSPCWSRHIVTTLANIGTFPCSSRNKAVTKRHRTRNRIGMGRSSRSSENDLQSVAEQRSFGHLMASE